jgi:hypothetical protein
MSDARANGKALTGNGKGKVFRPYGKKAEDKTDGIPTLNKYISYYTICKYVRPILAL